MRRVSGALLRSSCLVSLCWWQQKLRSQKVFCSICTYSRSIMRFQRAHNGSTTTLSKPRRARPKISGSAQHSQTQNRLSSFAVGPSCRFSSMMTVSHCCPAWTEISTSRSTQMVSAQLKDTYTLTTAGACNTALIVNTRPPGRTSPTSLACLKLMFPGARAIQQDLALQRSSSMAYSKSQLLSVTVKAMLSTRSTMLPPSHSMCNRRKTPSQATYPSL